jgi:hypothetical protein
MPRPPKGIGTGGLPLKAFFDIPGESKVAASLPSVGKLILARHLVLRHLDQLQTRLHRESPDRDFPPSRPYNHDIHVGAVTVPTREVPPPRLVIPSEDVDVVPINLARHDSAFLAELFGVSGFLKVGCQRF